MSERMSRQILSEARRSMEPSTADRDQVLRRVLTTAAAASVVGTAAAAAKASGAGSLAAAWFKGATLIKLGAAFFLMGGAVLLWTNIRTEKDAGEPSTPAAFSNKTTIEATTQPVATPTLFPSVASNAENGAETKSPSASVEEEEAPQRMETGSHEAVETVPRGGIVLKRHWSASHYRLETEIAQEEPGNEGDESLYLEISAMKRASFALRNGQPKDAIRILDNFERNSTAGIMQEEREGIRVLALCAMGLSDAATKAKQRFLSRSPSSPMAVRVRRACGEEE